jgi:hypothetical protein
MSLITDWDVTAKLFSDIGPRYAERHGGHLRILKLWFLVPASGLTGPVYRQQQDILLSPQGEEAAPTNAGDRQDLCPTRHPAPGSGFPATCHSGHALPGRDLRNHARFLGCHPQPAGSCQRRDVR